MVQRQKVFAPSQAEIFPPYRRDPRLREGLEGPIELDPVDKLVMSEIGGQPTIAVDLSPYYMGKLKATNCLDNKQSFPAAFTVEQKLRRIEVEVAYYRERAAYVEELVQHFRPLIEMVQHFLHNYEAATTRVDEDFQPFRKSIFPAAFTVEQKLGRIEVEVAYYRERAAYAEELVQHFRPLIEMVQHFLHIYKAATARVDEDFQPFRKSTFPAAFTVEQKLRRTEVEAAYYRTRAAYGEELVQHFGPLIEMARHFLHIYKAATARVDEDFRPFQDSTSHDDHIDL